MTMQETIVLSFLSLNIICCLEDNKHEKSLQAVRSKFHALAKTCEGCKRGDGTPDAQSKLHRSVSKVFSELEATDATETTHLKYTSSSKSATSSLR